MRVRNFILFFETVICNTEMGKKNFPPNQTMPHCVYVYTRGRVTKGAL